MSEGTNRITHVIDTNEASVANTHKKIAEVESANRAMVSNIRQGVQLGLFAAQAMGFMIDQTFALLVEALLLTIEVGLKAQAAITATSLGAFGIVGIIQVGTIIAMGILIVKIKQKRTESAQKWTAVVGGLRMAGFRG